MDGFEFVSDLVGAVAWPAAVVACAGIFRRKLGDLIPRLRTFEGGPSGIKATFEELTPLSEVVSFVGATSREDRPRSALSVNATWSPVVDRAVSSPREAVIDAWSMLDQQLNRLAARVDPGARDWMEASTALSELDQGVAILAAARELKKLRDVTVHSSDVPAPLDAVRYVTVSGDLARSIEDITASRSSPPSGEGDVTSTGEEASDE